MKTTNKKLQLKKETMAVLNDKSLFAINGGNNPNEEDGVTTIGSLTPSQCNPSFCINCEIEIPSNPCKSIRVCDESKANCPTGSSPCKH